MIAPERPTRVYRFGFSRYVACLGLTLAMLSVGRSQVSDLSSKSSLSKAINLRLKLTPLPLVLKAITKMGGVRLENVQTINDLKVNVFVKDVPEGVVLSRIAKVLGCEWKADGDLFRLVMDPEEKVRRERYIAAEELEARKEIEVELNTLAQLGTFDINAASREANSGLLRQPSGKSAADQAKQTELLMRSANPQDVMFGRYLASLDGAKVSAFWRGDVIVGSAPALPSASPGADGTDASGTASQVSPRRRRPPVVTAMFIQYDPLLYQVNVFQRGQFRTFGKRPAKVVTQFRPSPELAKLPFGKEVIGWDQPTLPDEAFLNAPVPPSSKLPTPNGPKLSVSDFLEHAFDETGVPIISDAFRQPAESQDLSHGAGPLSSWLKTLKEENHLFVRAEGGAILVRHAGFWRMRRFEAPEEVLAPLELKASKGSLSLDDYGFLVSRLTPEQAKAFSTKGAIATKINTVPIEKALPALQFYGSLDAKSIARSLKDGIAIDQLSSSQRQLFLEATIEGGFYGAAGIGAVPMLLRLVESGDTRGLGFLMRRDSVDVNGVAVMGRAMLFGVNLGEASTYKVAVSD